MSAEFELDSGDAQAVIYTTLNLQLLGDQEQVVSILEYYIQKHDVTEVPLIVIQIYLKSLAIKREYSAAFELLSRFVNSTSYASARSKEEPYLTKMQIITTLSVEYLQLFNQIIDVASPQFAENLLKQENEHILTFQTSFNKVQELYLRDPAFCDREYGNPLFREVVSRVVSLHRFLEAQCVSALCQRAQSGQQKLSALQHMIQLLLRINAFGDARAQNMHSDTVLGSPALHYKGCLMCVEAMRLLEGDPDARAAGEAAGARSGTADARENTLLLSTAGATSPAGGHELSQLRDNLLRFIQYIDNFNSHSTGPFLGSQFSLLLGYQKVTRRSIDAIKHEVLVVEILQLVDFGELLQCLGDELESLAAQLQQCDGYVEVDQKLQYSVKILVSVADIVNQKRFSLLSFALYLLCYKLEYLIAQNCARERENYFMDGQVSSIRAFAKNDIFGPFQRLLQQENLESCQQFQHLHLHQQYANIDSLLREFFNPLDYTAALDGEQSYELDHQIERYRDTGETQYLRNLTAYRLAIIYAEISQHLMQYRELDQALRYGLESVKIWPVEVAYFELIKVYNQLNDLRAARKTAIECSKYYPGNVQAKVMKGEEIGVSVL